MDGRLPVVSNDKVGGVKSKIAFWNTMTSDQGKK